MTNLALDARCEKALSNVLAGFNWGASSKHLKRACKLAFDVGLSGSAMSVFFSGDRDLEYAFQEGQKSRLAAQKKQAEKENRTDEEWTAIFNGLADEAGRTCGSSHDVYVSKFSYSVTDAIESLSENRQAELLVIARQWDYATKEELNESREWNAGNGYCRHGIELGCCPAGCE
jgi:hypothetical protein